MVKSWPVIAGVLFLAFGAGAETLTLEQARDSAAVGQFDKAIGILNALRPTQKEEREQAMNQLLLGSVYLRMGKAEDARRSFEKSLVLKSNLSAYAFLLLGDSYYRLKRYGDARAALERLAYFKPPAELRFEARSLLGDIALAEHNLGEAERHFVYLERKWRRSPQYPEVLWRHLLTALERQNRGTVCRVARRLYSQLPSHPLTYDWGIELQNVSVAGQRLGCVATNGDQNTRIRRLQLAGAVDRAQREIEILRGSGRAEDEERADMMLVSYLTSDGYPDEALKILAKYYQAHVRDVPFLISLAKASARSGEFQTAVGLYSQINELSPSSRVGREALFQAAFLSYQFQDYDGATRRFERFIGRYPNSGLARDARWNLAWIRYLRSDFDGALSAFRTLLVGRGRQGRTHREARATYWMAMSLAKLGRSQEARDLFQALEKPDATDFYALAAQARRQRLPSPAPALLREPSLSPSGEVGPVVTLSAASEAESEENLSLNREAAPEEPGATDSPAVDLSEDMAVDSDDEERLVVTDFKDPRLRRHFEVAQDLIALGFTDWARQELYEVERRSRNSTYLKMLVRAYQDIQAFHRAVYVADTAFVQERLQLGMAGARSLWEMAFPRAFQSSVDHYAEKFSVPREWLWGIMRAESHFKPDVLSPVGAKGLMQIMPETGRQVARLLGDEGEFLEMSLMNPDTNVRLGARYLLRLGTKFKNSLPLVAAAYNGGPHRVDSWLVNFGFLDMDEFIEHIPFLETRDYVKKVVRNFAAYRRLYQNDSLPLSWLTDTVPVKVSARPAPREIWEAL